MSDYFCFYFTPSSGLSWIAGNAEELPIASEAVDAYTIAFGIRNVTHVQKVRLFKCSKFLQMR